MPEYQDFPLDDCIKAATMLASQGAEVYQKFTCERCGARLTVEEPNKFYKFGDCDRCHHVTNFDNLWLQLYGSVYFLRV